jgi:23S rRNA (guanosine2251-2'-O)-methyltransferase
LYSKIYISLYGEKTRETCAVIARIPFADAFGPLNVSNAAAIALYAALVL